MATNSQKNGYAPQDLDRTIREALQSMDHARVRALLPGYLKKCASAADARLSASSFYRSLEEYLSSVLVLRSLLRGPRGGLPRDGEPQLLLQYAAGIAALGGRAYAERVVNSIPRLELQALAPLMASYFKLASQPDQATRFLQNLNFDREVELLPHLEISLSLARNLFQLSKFTESNHLYLEVLMRLPESEAFVDTRAEALLGLGATHFMLGNFDSAQRFVAQAEFWVRNRNSAVRRSELALWQGVLNLHAKDFSAAQVCFNAAWSDRFRPAHAPELWIEILYWQGFAELMQSETGRIPREWCLLLGYPHHTAWVQRQISKHVNLPEYLTLSYGGRPAIADPQFVVDFSSETLIYPESAPQPYKLGIGLAEVLLGHLNLAGEVGIPEYRLYELLWPDELNAFHFLGKRLEQAVLSLRKRGYPVKWGAHHLWLTQSVSINTHFSIANRQTKGQLFLTRQTQEFRRRDVEKFFLIAPTQAKGLCKYWQLNGLIETTPQLGRRTAYRVVSNKLNGQKN